MIKVRIPVVKTLEILNNISESAFKIGVYTVDGVFKGVFIEHSYFEDSIDISNEQFRLLVKFVKDVSIASQKGKDVMDKKEYKERWVI